MSRRPVFDCTRWSFGLPHKRHFGGGFLKIGDGAESNQNRAGVKWIPGITTPKLIFAKTTPCTVDMPLKELHFFQPNRLPVILRCEWRGAQRRAGSLEGWTARMWRRARIFPAGTAGLSPFEGR